MLRPVQNDRLNVRELSVFRSAAQRDISGLNQDDSQLEIHDENCGIKLPPSGEVADMMSKIGVLSSASQGLHQHDVVRQRQTAPASVS